MFCRVLQGIIAVGAAIALFSVLSTGMYYLMPVTGIGLAACAAMVCGLFAVGYKVGYGVNPISQPTHNPHITHSVTYFSLLTSLASLAFWWYAVLTHPIVESIRSPWLAINPSNLLALFVPFVISVALFNKSRTASFVILVLTIFSAFSFAAAAYPLGYGFDPFLHRATIQHIADHGTITPKPLYYIGQYVIELFALKILHLPLLLVDVFLVPLLASTLIPAAVFLGAVGSGKGSTRGSTPTVLLFLPLAAFIQTTPQALAFVFTATAILLTAPSLLENKKPNLVFPSIFALAALVAHPLAGLSAVFYLAMIAVTSTTFARHGGVKNPAFAQIAVVCVSAIALPLAFIAQSLKANLPLGLHVPTLANGFGLAEPLLPWVGTHFNAWGDTAYLVIGNLFVVTVALGIFGAYRMHTNAGRRMGRPLQRYIPLIAAGIAFANFLILGLFFDFPFLISYERGDFAGRMLTLTVLFLLPYVPKAFASHPAHPDPSLSGSGPQGEYSLTHRAFALGVVGIVFVSSVYGAYPRYDAYASSAGFNVTKADIAAVQAIEEYAAGRDYVVLANQATSSAAIQELGFKKYYHGDIFFYPIPTGGDLYKLYISMADAPNDSTIKKARELTGAQLVFFVMSDYWWESKKVIEQTKPLASDVWTFEQGDVTVMVFDAS